jgi:plastocyanin domain-containing protein
MNMPNGLNPWVLIGETLLVLGLLWFLFVRRKSTFSPDPRTLQKFELKLSGKLMPDKIQVRVNVPTQLIIHRFEDTPDDELFEIEAFDIYELLPALHTTIIAFTPQKTGSFPMVLAGERHAGTIIVQ